MMPSPRLGFTLVELMVVIVIIAIAMSMVVAFGRGTKRDTRAIYVRQEAEQLASVLRQARSLAIDRKSSYAVTFNITNGRGTSGRVLNNHDGGHWYRLIGPAQHNLEMEWYINFGTGNASSHHLGYNAVFRPNRGQFGYNLTQCNFPWGTVEDEEEADAVSEKYVLKPGAVRFLAVTDEDNGNMHCGNDTFGPTYPRPWFGEFDQVTKTMHPWGGYEPELEDYDQPAKVPNPDPWNVDFFNARKDPTAPSRNMSYSGFYYEGIEGKISGCVNPNDRFIYEDIDGDGFIGKSPLTGVDSGLDTPTRLLYGKGEPRALVNGKWMDITIEFLPDGSAHEWDPFANRRMYNLVRSWGGTFSEANGKFFLCSPGDRTNREEPYIQHAYGTKPQTYFEASNYDQYTGAFYITLAPDTEDRWQYDSIQEAYQTMFPMFRVAVTRVGEVKVFEIRKQLPQGVTLDAKFSGNWWESPTATQANGFGNNLAVDSSGVAEMPVVDAVTYDMLSNRMWWIKN